MNTAQAVSGYLAYCQANGASFGTIANKQSILGRFAQDNPQLPLNPEPIFHFIAGCGKSQATRETARKHIRAFYTWACGEFDLPDPMPQVAVPLRAAKRPRAGQSYAQGGGRTDVLIRPSPAPTAALLSTSEGIAAFLASSGPKGRRSEKTQEWYNSTTFAPFAAQFKYLPTELEPLEEFIFFPESEHLCGVRYRCLNALYRWLYKRRDIPNPLDKMDAPSSATRSVIPLDDAEIDRLLSTELTDQENALLHALLTTGMRPGEARNLMPESIMADTIVLDGKTGRDRMPIKPDVRELLLKVSGQVYVFEDDEGRPLTKDGFYRILENIMLRARVREGKGGARLFRHTFITRVYGKTGDPFLVQRLARHTTLTMTKHYEHSALDSTIKKYQELEILPRKKNPGAAEAEGPGIGAPEEGLFEGEPPPEEMEGSGQLGFEIPRDWKAEPTPPYTIKEYAYRLPGQEKGDPLKCWRIVGTNGAWWPITGKPHNFLNFEDAQAKMRELWVKG